LKKRRLRINNEKEMTIFLQIDVLLILELSAWAVIFIIPGIIISNYIRNRKKEKK